MLDCSDQKGGWGWGDISGRMDLTTVTVTLLFFISVMNAMFENSE